MFFNPWDISKDGGNDFIDGIKYHLRESDLCKDKIKNYLKENIYYHYNLYHMPTPLEILNEVMKKLNIKEDDLTIADEHELLDWITCQIK